MIAGQQGFWDIEDRLTELSAEGDPLERLSATVDFDLFRPVLVMALQRDKAARLGRPPFCPVLKFKMLVLQSLHGLSLERTAYMVRDRPGWIEVLWSGRWRHSAGCRHAVGLQGKHSIKAKALDRLFMRLGEAIGNAGYLPMGGQIVDASLIAAPRQKDIDARWTLKQGKAPAPDAAGKGLPAIAVPVFGYKDHISIDLSFGQE